LIRFRTVLPFAPDNFGERFVRTISRCRVERLMALCPQMCPR
jgi:hypothetical protein